MKKILLLFACVAMSMSVTAQSYFTLTETGLVPTTESDKNFIVIEKSGVSQQELFNTIKNFATQFYASPKDVISESGNDMITLNGVSSKDVYCKKGLGVLSVRMNYTIVFSVKDGKIRIDAPSINRMTSESSNLGGTEVTNYQICLTKNSLVDLGYDRVVIFDKKIKQETKNEIEAFFNTLIDKAINYTAPQKEDW